MTTIQELNELNDAIQLAFEKELVGVKREGLDNLLLWLKDSDFYLAPASTRFHLAEPGGLAIHSIHVLNIAKKLNKVLGEPCTEESLIICSLFHDLGKHKYFGKDFYNKKPLLKSGKEPAQPYERNKDLISVPHEISSIHILSKFIPLTEDETWAILQHNGMYSDLKYTLNGKETELQMIIHWADMWASRVIER